MDRLPKLPKLLYDKREAAEILNISVSSIEWLLRTGRLPHRKISGKIRFTRGDLEAFIDASAVTCAVRGDRKEVS